MDRAVIKAVAGCCGAMLLLAGLTEVAAQPTPAGFDSIEIAVKGARAATIKAYLRRPVSDKAVPAVVLLHGCGGLFRRDGQLAARDVDWAERLVGLGYAVLLPDSFNPRGFRQICKVSGSDRPIRPRHRAADAFAAVSWLTRQPFVDGNRVALMGWSNGGTTVLMAADKLRLAKSGAALRTAIAFYPGCRLPAERADYAVGLPLTILIGSDDDWTAPGPCRELAKRPGIRLIEYSGAVHGFDAPNSPRRTRRGVGLSASGDGQVQIGTDPAARAASIEAVTRILAKAFAEVPPR